jgi:hypothetical protein
MTLIHGIQANDSPSIDAFSRWRVSNPTTLFESRFRYDLAPLQYEATVTGAATITHDATNAAALFTTTSAAAQSAIMQSYRWIRYQPGKSQLVLLTFVLGTAAANVTRRVGLFNGTAGDGIYLEQTGASTVNLCITSTSSIADQTVAQAAWNLDKLDGTGPSGITLDLTKAQILVIDFQWLGVGRVRVGFDIGGVVHYAHEFLHANSVTAVYMQSATLPIRAELVTGAAVAATMRIICASVQSEGGNDDISGYQFSTEFVGTAGNGVRVHLGSFRPFLTFNSIPVRYPIIPLDATSIVTGNSGVLFELVFGATFSAGPTWAGAAFSAYSGAEVTTAAGTIATTPIVATSWYTASLNSGSASFSKALRDLYPIVLNAAAANIALGTMSIYATGATAGSACRVSLQWKEIR